MLTINILNVEDIIFKNNSVWDKLPELLFYRDQWALSQQHSFLRSLGKQAVLDFMNLLTEQQLEILQKHFGCPVTIDKLDNRVVQTLICDMESSEQELNQLKDNSNLFLYRNKDQIYISSWR